MTDLFTRPCKVCGKSLQPRQRACCSRRCALRAGWRVCEVWVEELRKAAA